VTANEVRAQFQVEPYAVKKMASNAWAQFVWSEQGGEGIHPIAWRPPGGRVLFVNEARWSEVGEPSELIQPHEVLEQRGQVPQAYTRTLADPRTATQPPEPVRPGTQPSAPPVPRAPAPRRVAAPPAVQRVFAMTEEEAIAAYRTDPARVRASTNSTWHENLWYRDFGQPRNQVPPIAITAGTVFVDVARASPEFLQQIGMGMRL
jgi:hypothetical protein